MNVPDCKFKIGDRVVRMDEWENINNTGTVYVVTELDTFMTGQPAIRLDGYLGKYDPKVYVHESVYYSPLEKTLR